MAQTLKPEVRERLLAAAAATFARAGYEGARLADIAAEAGVSTGNVYRYFHDKDALFAEVVPRATVARLLLLRSRIRELRGRSDWGTATVGGSDRADALLEFWIEHRLAIVIALGHAQGSPLAYVRPLVEAQLMRISTHQLTVQGRSLPPTERLVLDRLFASTVDMIVHILASHSEPVAIRRAFAVFWRFQLAGLQALFAPLLASPNGS